jgi:hypothetical protein
MEIVYDVVWREDGRGRPGRLKIGPDDASLRLHGGDEVVAELAYDQLVAVTLHVDPDGRRLIELAACGDRNVELESTFDEWILRDLVEKLLEHALDTKDIPLRFLVSCEPAPLRAGLGFS